MALMVTCGAIITASARNGTRLKFTKCNSILSVARLSTLGDHSREAAGAMLGQVVAVRWARSAGLPVSSSLPDWICDCGLALLLVDKRV